MPHNWQQHLDDAIDEIFPRMVAMRRHLHAHPEPSGQERQTARFIHEQLQTTELLTQLVTNDCGVIVDSNTNNMRPRIAIRADLDALWIQDEKQTDYSSRVPGVMHACGHDGHAAMVFGVVLGLHLLKHRDQMPWPVAWRGIFQPAEETSEGAVDMIESGVLDGVSSILGVHLDPSRDVGVIGLRNGALTAACDMMEIVIRGRGGHAARPHESIDPIAAAAQLISSLYLFVPRSVDTHDPAVLTIGQICGGHTPNVIPDVVQLTGTLRTLSPAVRDRTKDHIRQLASGLAQASGTTIEIKFQDGPPAVINAPELVKLLCDAGKDALGKDAVQTIERPSMGGEDFAYYTEQIPGAMFRLGCRSGPESAHPLHSAKFDIDESALREGAKILARAAIMWGKPKDHK